MKEIIKRTFEENLYTVVPYDDNRIFFTKGVARGIVKISEEESGFTIIYMQTPKDIDIGEIVVNEANTGICIRAEREENRTAINVALLEKDEAVIRAGLVKCFFIAENVLQNDLQKPGESTLKASGSRRRKVLTYSHD